MPNPPSKGPPSGASPRREELLGCAAAGVFTFSVGMSGIAVPLIALSAGLGATQVGVLATLTAAAQLLARLGLGPAAARFPDRSLVAVAGILLAVSNLIVLVDAIWVTLAACQVLQGVARAVFWTGSQAHAVRASRSAVQGLASLNFVAGVGGALGPLVAGVLLAFSERATMASAAVVGLGTVVPAMALVVLPPLLVRDRRPRVERRQLRRRRRRGSGEPRAWSGVAWTTVTPGGWRALLTSYVPVILDASRHSSSVIGALVAAANGASIVGSMVAGRVRGPFVERALTCGIVATGFGLAVAATASSWLWAAAAALVVSGVGSGLVQTLGPGFASQLAGTEDQGQVIMATGTYRSASLLLAPLGAAGLGALVGLAPAVTVLGIAIATPGWFLRRSFRRRC
ncbi:MFS transporter [Nocardioides pyridinolyticus]